MSHLISELLISQNFLYGGTSGEVVQRRLWRIFVMPVTVLQQFTRLSLHGGTSVEVQRRLWRICYDQRRCCNKVTRLFSSRWTSGEVFLSRWTSGEVFLLWWTSVEVTSFTVDFWQSNFFHGGLLAKYFFCHGGFLDGFLTVEFVRFLI